MIKFLYLSIQNEKIEELKNIAATLNETEVPSEDDVGKHWFYLSLI